MAGIYPAIRCNQHPKRKAIKALERFNDIKDGPADTVSGRYRWQNRQSRSSGVFCHTEGITHVSSQEVKDVLEVGTHRPDSRRYRAGRTRCLPLRQRLYADARRTRHNLRRRALRPLVRGARSPCRNAVAPRPRHRDAVRRRTL